MSQFINVKEVLPAVPNVGKALDIAESVVVRDSNGRYIETLIPLASGHFQATVGIVSREDLGEYVIRRMGHPAARQAL